MSLNRRKALITMAAPFLVGFDPAEAQFAPVGQRFLGKLVDLILPQDAQSPAASALFVHVELQEVVQSHELLARLFEYGLSWLDQVGGRPFLDLPEAVQIEILQFASQADFNQVPGRFFAVLRLMACDIYFSKAEAIEGYPLQVAPQPEGYPPPWS